MKIGFIGNFIPKHSTENDRKWSFEKLGHEVITFQENQTNDHQLLEAANYLDVLFYSHTHDPSYVIENLRKVFHYYKERGIPTVSVHLDRWLGLNRVTDMGKEATWFTEYIFMADGSPEAAAKYDELKLNWHYLKPGVVERDCYLASPDRKRFPHEIVFVGSKGYHPEYPWRPALIDWLNLNYKNRFGMYGNDGIMVARGEGLNQLYASAKIVVGDSCFAGQTKNYWSDRVAETTGRGGFLLHPKVEGLDHQGVVYFEPENFDDLRNKINYYLEHDDEREKLRIKGFEWTKQNATYTQRCQEMLEIIFKK